MARLPTTFASLECSSITSAIHRSPLATSSRYWVFKVSQCVGREEEEEANEPRLKVTKRKAARAAMYDTIERRRGR